MMRALILLSLCLTCACTTVTRPIRPDVPLALEGDAVPALRFEGDSVVVRDPGMPLGAADAWGREVGNYTAKALNASLGAGDDGAVAATVVTFDLASPAPIQIGTWKDMTISLKTTLPDGRVVKSTPVQAPIDDVFEAATLMALNLGGTALDITAAVSMLLFVLNPSNLAFGIVALSAFAGGLMAHAGQTIGQYVVAQNEEKRWSNLYAQALRAHAADIRRALQQAALPLPPQTTTAPPPPLLDPADPRAAAPQAL